MDDGFDGRDDDAHEPPPPGQRAWRHPSELGAERLGNPTRFVTRPVYRTPTRVWLATGLGALVGAVSMLAVIGLTGNLRTVEREPTGVERQHVVDLEANPDRPIAIASAVIPAVARVQTRGVGVASTGTAVVFNSNGYLLTTADLLDGSDEITVTFADGEEVPAAFVGADRESDIAVLRVDRTGLPVVVLGRPADQLQLGEPVLAIDSTLGEAGTPKIPPLGVINGLGKRVESEDPSNTLFGLIQTNLQLTSDATGAPLVDANGAVIGIITSRGLRVPGLPGRSAAPSAPVATSLEGVTAVTGNGPDPSLHARCATPIDVARLVAAELIRTGTYQRSSLGITEGATLTEAEAQRWDVTGGIRITGLRPGGPAAVAGLNEGDVVVKLENEAITSWDALVVALRRYQPGDMVTLWYYRSGTTELQPELVILDAR